MKILLSGGKTMGHISPLLALNEAWKNTYEIVYFGLSDSMEEEMCQKNGITFYKMKLYPFYRKNWFKNIKTFYAIWKTKKKIQKDFCHSDIKAIICSGGFVSIPLLRAFRKNKKTKKILLELNSSLGLANRFLLPWVDVLSTQFPLPFSKAIQTGCPVYESKRKPDHPFFYTKKKRVLFVGGSNGALEIVRYAYEYHLANPEVLCIVSTGKRYFNTYAFQQNARVYESIPNLIGYFSHMDLIVTRAGGATIAELLYTKSIALLVPSLNVSGHHQEKNAKTIKAFGVFKIHEIGDINKEIKELLENSALREEMRLKQEKLIQKNAIKAIEALLSLLLACFVL